MFSIVAPIEMEILLFRFFAEQKIVVESGRDVKLMS